MFYSLEYNCNIDTHGMYIQYISGVHDIKIEIFLYYNTVDKKVVSSKTRFMFLFKLYRKLQWTQTSIREYLTNIKGTNLMARKNREII